ncbi:MAG: hypothetical protein R2748_26500 [Bryobacterales bacterium]
MAYSGRPEAIAKIMAAMPKGDDNTQLQVHCVYCLREIKKGWTPEQKDELIAWFEKAREWRGGASYPGFINRLFDSSLAFFTPEEKKMKPTSASRSTRQSLTKRCSRGMRGRGGYTPANVFRASRARARAA